MCIKTHRFVVCGILHVLIHSVECNCGCCDRTVTFCPVLSEADTTVWRSMGEKEGGNRGRREERWLSPQPRLGSPHREGLEVINFDLFGFLQEPYDVQIPYT